MFPTTVCLYCIYQEVARNCNVPLDFTQPKTLPMLDPGPFLWTFSQPGPPPEALPAICAPVCGARTGRPSVPDFEEATAMYRFEFLLSITIILATAVLGIGTQNKADRIVKPYPNFDLEVVVNGRPL